MIFFKMSLAVNKSGLMNRISRIFFGFSILLFAIQANGQNKFEGQVDFKMEYEEIPAEMEMMKGMLPTEMAMLIKGDRSRIEQSMMMGMKQATIVDMKSEKIHILMDAMGQKMKMTMDMKEEEEKRGAKDDIDIKYVEGEKLIAGYKCKRAEITSKESKAPLVVYYTEEIPGALSREFKGLKGFPLEYGHSDQGMTVKITATKVDQKQLDESLFVVSDDYEEMDPQMIERMMGGQ
ncbi:MAG: GLPGLI family protein [Granulosicoccus sp.]|jgi:GLPGLI family protein